jgi:hypothetical protein
MDRNIVYPGSIPLDTDLLGTNRNAMVAIGALIGAVLGQGVVTDGLGVSPTSPAGLGVVVAAGVISQYAPLDQNAYGSLGSDTADSIMKMGVLLQPTSFTLAAPAASGQSVNYVIQATFSEADVNPVVLPYYNAANPAQPFLGPANTGAAQPTLRQQLVQLQLKAGAPGIAGAQATPPVDTGWTGLAVVTVNYGQTQIVAANIAATPSNTLLPYKLPDLRPGFAEIAAFGAGGDFTVPSGVSRLRVTVIGGGGAGGTHASEPGGGGGAGGQAVGIVIGLMAGTVIPVTVGAAGEAPGTPGNGGNGGTSSFGAYLSATGGFGGIGGTALAVSAGGSGGGGIGGLVNYPGSWGTDGITATARGGDGGGPGNGRGTSGLIQGIAAPGWGGGGGGGGASQAGGGGAGALGGNGGSGLVIVEF